MYVFVVDSEVTDLGPLRALVQLHDKLARLAVLCGDLRDHDLHVTELVAA
jgi:hypothetical protein